MPKIFFIGLLFKSFLNTTQFIKETFLIIALFLLTTILFAQALKISPNNIRLEPDYGTGDSDSDIIGYNLFIEKTPALQSVMLTETTKDPEMKEPNYAYRAETYNSTNGDEKRILDGKFLESNYSKYSLISSTIVDDSQFKKAFHIYIPRKMIYGYPWARNGEVIIGKGTFINIRAFEKPYCDYSGAFYDNPYMFDFQLTKKRTEPPAEEPAELPPPPQPIFHEETQAIIEPPMQEVIKEEDITPEPKQVVLTDDYNPETARKFNEFSLTLTYSKGPDTIVDDIMNILDNLPIKNRADIVFAIDATGSMKDDIEKLRNEWIPRLDEWVKKYRQIRVGLLLYRDYPDAYRYKGIPIKFFDFTTNIENFKGNLNGFTIKGTEGGDIPEAVYEALYGSIMFYKWDKNALRKVILIGDAPPHPHPRNSGMYSKELVQRLAKEKEISIDSIITPDDKSRRGR